MTTEHLQRLQAAPLRTCQILRRCCLCDLDIYRTQQYRDGGFGRRAHETCLREAVLRDEARKALVGE